jgi:hypothetical protein
MARKKPTRNRALASYRVRYTETICWEVVVEAEGEEHAREIVGAGNDEDLAHRLPRWKHGHHDIESVELIDEG